MATSTAELVGHLPDDPDAFQWQILPLVSRTFALTIPQLPGSLAAVVANAYLLCRIADTIEDDPGPSSETKSNAHEAFIAALGRGTDIDGFGPRTAALLVSDTPVAERLLVERSARVIEITRSLPAHQRDAVVECVEVMCRGMAAYQRNASLSGLADIDALDRYCYYVAGVVGEMLTELFIAHCPAVEPRRRRLAALAPSFGEGLQLTNILKDLWDDRRRGACWLPRDLCRRHGIEPADLEAARGSPAFEGALRELIGIAHGHLRNALEYTLTIPRSETGVRRFCLWAIGMALLTLRRIDRQPHYTSGAEVKIPRRWVRSVVLVVNASARSDRTLRWLFDMIAAGLPRPPAVTSVTSPGPIDDETSERP